MKELRHRGGQPENINASNERRGLPRGIAVHVSIPGELRASLEAKLAQDLHRTPDEDEVRDFVKALARHAIHDYIDASP